MSEDSHSKTKRNIRDLIEHYQPSYRVSMVLPSLSNDDVIVLTDNLGSLKKRVARTNPESVVIFWLMSHYLNTDDGRKAFPVVNMFFTHEPIPELKAVIEGHLGIDVKLIKRGFLEGQRDGWVASVRKGRLHDLKTVYGKANLKRVSVYNKAVFV